MGLPWHLCSGPPGLAGGRTHWALRRAHRHRTPTRTFAAIPVRPTSACDFGHGWRREALHRDHRDRASTRSRSTGGQAGLSAATTAPPAFPRARRAATECHGELAPDPGPIHGEREGAARQPLPIPSGIPYHTIPPPQAPPRPPPATLPEPPLQCPPPPPVPRGLRPTVSWGVSWRPEPRGRPPPPPGTHHKRKLPKVLLRVQATSPSRKLSKVHRTH